ncbi:MAG TPA: DUF1648 domain-containing protein [Candidatus Nanoarchaeia archaeon]|nr:DUF1648 domain-containing protein [Candidatus Nanoarchaeia archaeon]
MKLINLALMVIVALSFLTSAYFYDSMPERIAVHWDAKGQVNGYMDKAYGMFFVPVISLIIILIFWAASKSKPVKENIKNFGNHYYGFSFVLFLFLYYVQVLTIIWNKGVKFSIIIALVPALSFLLYFIGVLIQNTKRNLFVGIRTPWTLKSDKVWEKTHKKGAKLFKISAIVSLLGLFFRNYAVYIIIIPILCFTIYLVLFSYLEYRKETKHNPKLRKEKKL